MRCTAEYYDWLAVVLHAMIKNITNGVRRILSVCSSRNY